MVFPHCPDATIYDTRTAKEFEHIVQSALNKLRRKALIVPARKDHPIRLPAHGRMPSTCEGHDGKERNALGLAAKHTDLYGHTTRAECQPTSSEFSRPGPKLRFRAVRQEGTWWIKDYRDPKHPVVVGGPFSRTHAQRLAKRFNEEKEPILPDSAES